MTAFDPAVPTPRSPDSDLHALYAASAAEPVERVGRGLALALVAIPVATVATVVVWRLGFIASITSFLLAGLAVFLYTRGAGTTPRRGLVPVIALVIVGIAISFLSVVASDLVDVHRSGVLEGDGGSVSGFVAANLFYGPVLSSYGGDFALFLVFAALGVFSTMRRLSRG